jgi:ribosomal protein S12 methylthiotransferase accessory factor
VLEHCGDLLRWIRKRERQSYLFDITGNHGIPVVAAVSAEPDGSDVVMGFAARPNLHDAALHASTELAQIEFSLQSARIWGDNANHWKEWREAVSMSVEPFNSHCYNVDLRRVQALTGSRVLFARMPTRVTGFCSVRAISPGFFHTKPRLCATRNPKLDTGESECWTAHAQHPLLI